MSFKVTNSSGGFSANVVLLITLVVVGVAAGLFLLMRFDQQQSNKVQSQNDSGQDFSTAPPYKPPMTQSNNEASLAGKINYLEVDPPAKDAFAHLQGQVKEISPIKELIKFKNNWPVRFYEVGSYGEGPYAGYKTIIITGPERGIMSPEVHYLLTKDNQSYLLVLSRLEFANAKKDAIYGEYSDLNFKQIVGIAPLVQSHPEVIKLAGNWGLYRQEIYTSPDPTAGNVLKIGTEGMKEIASPIAGLRFFEMPYELSQWQYIKDDAEKNVRSKYLDRSSTVYVENGSGLIYSYVIGFYDQVNSYEDLAIKASVSQGKTPYPLLPGYAFKKDQIITPTPLFNEYSVAFPSACGFNSPPPIIKNVSDNDVTRIGSFGGNDLFVLNDPNHSLNWLEWQRKIANYDDDLFKSFNKSDKPTYQQYVAKHPVILMKDVWGQFVALGEFDIKLPGGCAKPVIYLYPEKPTEVSVKFTSQIRLDTTIPSYADGWKVLAFPNGKLFDLQSEKTNCSALPSSFGTEYALAACLMGQYPYLYWTGQSVEKEYPQASGGWVVNRGNLAIFFDGKLQEVGLNQNERTDMESYWLAKMLEKKFAYYRVSFLTTAQMNQLAPMSITPNPDSVYRIFLDWQGINDPTSFATLPPQNLPKIDRKGFSVVEWGGLKQ